MIPKTSDFQAASRSGMAYLFSLSYINSDYLVPSPLFRDYGQLKGLKLINELKTYNDKVLSSNGKRISISHALDDTDIGTPSIYGPHFGKVLRWNWPQHRSRVFCTGATARSDPKSPTTATDGQRHQPNRRAKNSRRRRARHLGQRTTRWCGNTGVY